MTTGISVCIPAHRPRLTDGCLDRAIASVGAQTLPPDAVAVAVDLDHDGAPITRQRALETVTTPWVAFLDSDDEFKPDHLQQLYAHAQETGADYVYSWFDVVGGKDPFAEHFGQPWNPDDPIQTTITILVRTDLAQEIGFTHIDPEPGGVMGEDFRFTLGCQAAGGRIVHLPARTWYWHHDSPGGNTSGRPDRWR